MKSVEKNGADRPTALAYLAEQSALVRAGGYWNCLNAARELSALMLAGGREPWIARLRKTESLKGEIFHAPLIPLAPDISATWTTHYVCCGDGMAYDPVAGEALRLEDYSLKVFGARISTEVFVPFDKLSAYLAGDWSPSAS